MVLSNVEVVICLVWFADVIKRRAGSNGQSQALLVPKWRNID